jgi:phosphoadenosine phosphosulfate reductase
MAGLNSPIMDTFEVQADPEVGDGYDGATSVHQAGGSTQAWLFRGIGLASLMLIGVSACVLSASPSHTESSSGFALAFNPAVSAVRGTNMVGQPQARGMSGQRRTPSAMQMHARSPMERTAFMPGRASFNQGMSASSSSLRSAPPAMVMSSPMMPQMEQQVEMLYDPLQQPEQQPQPTGAEGSYSTLGWLSLLAVTAGGAFMAGKKSRQAAPKRAAVAMSMAKADGDSFDQEAFIAESKEMRLKYLEEQAMFALKTSCENFENPVFPNAMIAGDCVITHLLDRLGYLKNGKCKIMVVDTFHLFDETVPFLHKLEDHYGFKAEIFGPEGIPLPNEPDGKNKKVFDDKYGANLWKEDIEQYDKICKVEPFQRGLKTLNTDCMINGRTRWQGFERAWIDQFENAPIGGGLAKCNPIAYWTFEDTFDYIAKYKVPYHPSCENGYPSHGDAKDTVPVPSMDERAKKQEEGFTAFKDFEWVGDKTKWCDYATERVGRFVGLVNKDGSLKTECGIHVAGAEKTFDRDLWDKADSVIEIASTDDVEALKKSGKEAMVVVYAPWCQFCQKMEDEYAKLGGAAGIPTYKFRGDEERQFVEANMNTASFPTINFLSKDGKLTKYESEERTVEAMKAFAESCK